MLFAHADWLARRWLAKYYSPPLRWIIVINEDLKNLWQQNNDFKFTVDSKEEETEVLKDQINKLQSEKKELQTALRDVKVEPEAVRKEAVFLKGKNSSLKGKWNN